VRPGGFYVIEDLWTAYRAGWGGADSADSPPQTSVGLLKSLLDAIQYEEHPAGADPGAVAQSVVGVHVYHNVAFIEKGHNAEGGVPPWMPGSYDELMDTFPKGDA
jgi:demethylmacrocin O-methyltransferase